MGLFDKVFNVEREFRKADSFESFLRTTKSPLNRDVVLASAISGSGGNPFGASAAQHKNVFGSDRTSRLIGGILSPSTAIYETASDPRQREKFTDKVKEFFHGKDENAPPVPEAPAQGADTEEMKRRARQQAVEAARRRKGFDSTVATSPLGLVGKVDTSLGTKRLLGL